MSTRKKAIAIFIFLLALFGIALFVWFWQAGFNSTVEVAPQAEQTKQSAGETKIFIKFPEVTNDDDKDGVTNDLEKKYGTSDANIDTDHDGLTDKIEIEKLGTNPTKFDTDGDGFSDGVEVTRGFNPLGPGKLQK